MRRLILAVGVVLLAIVARGDEPLPSMTCKAVGTWTFQCVAKNFGELEPHWALYDARQPFLHTGQTFTGRAPFQWTVVEAQIVMPEGTYILRAWVRRRQNRAVFMPFDWSKQP